MSMSKIYHENINVRLTADDYRALCQMAHEKEVFVSDIVRQLISLGLQRADA